MVPESRPTQAETQGAAAADPWAPGGMYDKSTVTLADRTRCFALGHDVRDWGTICGWCRRCKHSVHTYDRKSVLYYGEFHRFPPAHD